MLSLSILVLCVLQSGSGPLQVNPIDKLGRIFPIDGGMLGRALDVDGDSLFVGAPNGGPAGPPAVFVLDGSTGAWVFDQLLLPDDPQLDYSFGSAVDSEGGVLAVGAPFTGNNGYYTEIGRVYLFEETGGTWGQAVVLEPTMVSGSLTGFGSILGLSGSTLAVGGFSVAGTGHSIFVYEQSGSTWTQTATVTPSSITSSSLSLSLDQDTLLVGAFRDDPSGIFNGGSAIVFERTGTMWSETAKLTPSDAILGDEFGARVALEGDLAAISSGSASGGSADGAVYLFQRSGSTWTETAKLTASSGLAAGDFGVEIALHNESVYARSRDSSIYVFRPVGPNYVEQARLMMEIIPSYLPPGPVVAGATNVFAGYPNDDAIVQDGGSVYVFPALDPQTYCTAKQNSLGCTPKLQTQGSISATYADSFMVAVSDVLNNKPGLLFYGTSGPFAVPFFGGTLCVNPPLRRTLPQTSGGNPPPEDCSGSLSLDFNAHLQSGADPMLAVGDQVWAQFWHRDPADADGVGLSDAVAFIILP